MIRATFIKHLRKIGEIPIPEGHNKGSSCYFFASEQRETVQNFLKEHLGEPTQRDRPYPKDTLSYVVLNEKKWVDRSVLLWPATEKEDFVIVSILKWNC